MCTPVSGFGKGSSLNHTANYRTLTGDSEDWAMLNFNDITANIDEPGKARMEQRMKPHVKAQIQQAAALLGVDDTTFITSVALERARATIADHERTVLCAEDRESILAALDSPPTPTDDLREVMALHSTHVESSV